LATRRRTQVGRTRKQTPYALAQQIENRNLYHIPEKNGVVHHSKIGSRMTAVGPPTDLTAPKCDFRSSPESGLKSDIGPCPVRADFVAKVESCIGPNFW